MQSSIFGLLLTFMHLFSIVLIPLTGSIEVHVVRGQGTPMAHGLFFQDKI